MKMKRIHKVIVLLTTFFVVGQGVVAQDFVFSQFYANPLYLNPALAGAKICPRFSLNYRNQWPGLVSAFTTVSTSYDQYFSDLHGGIGAFVLTDRQGDHGALKTNQVSFMYSFRFQLSRTIYMNAALQASLINENLDWSTLTFPDQIDPDFGFIFNTQAVPPEDMNLFYADFNAGLLVYSKAWYGGLAVSHLTQPSNGFYHPG